MTARCAQYTYMLPERIVVYRERVRAALETTLTEVAFLAGPDILA